jgi:hypothetical protein
MVLVPLTAAVALAACSPSPGAVSAPRGSPVPGAQAFVGHHTVGPVYVGEYIGKLKKVAGACEGSSGSGGTGRWDVAIRFDSQCRVYVSSITRGGGNQGPPAGGTMIPPTEAP